MLARSSPHTSTFLFILPSSILTVPSGTQGNVCGWHDAIRFHDMTPSVSPLLLRKRTHAYGARLRRSSICCCNEAVVVSKAPTRSSNSRILSIADISNSRTRSSSSGRCFTAAIRRTSTISISQVRQAFLAASWPVVIHSRTVAS